MIPPFHPTLYTLAQLQTLSTSDLLLMLSSESALYLDDNDKLVGERNQLTIKNAIDLRVSK